MYDFLLLQIKLVKYFAIIPETEIDISLPD